MKRLAAAWLAGLAFGSPAAEANPSFEALLERANRYTMYEWYPRHFSRGITEFTERGVRPATSQVLGLARAARARLYPHGRARYALALTRRILREVARRHGDWGGQWQSAMWAAEAGTAMLLVRDRLPRKVRLAVRQMGHRRGKPVHRLHRAVLPARRRNPLPGRHEGRGELVERAGARGRARLEPGSSQPSRMGAEQPRAARLLAGPAAGRPGSLPAAAAGRLERQQRLRRDEPRHRRHPDYAAAILRQTAFQAIPAALRDGACRERRC
jgi:hypothetical protein